MRAIVLAEGQTGSLGPLTLDIPTLALPVAGVPLVARMLDYLEAQGVTEAVVSCYRWPHLVERGVECRTGQLPVTIALQSSPASSLNPVWELAAESDESFIVVMGNVLTDLDLRAAIAAHEKWGAVATVVATPSDPPCLYGEVTTDREGAVVMIGSEQLVLREGKRTANAGMYILSPDIFRYLGQGQSFDLAGELLPRLVELEMPVFASVQEGYWHSLTSHDDYRAVNVDLVAGHVQGMVPEGQEVSEGVWVADGARIDPDVTLTPPILIGRGCRVERDASIGPEAILGEGVQVAAVASCGAQLSYRGARSVSQHVSRTP